MALFKARARALDMLGRQQIAGIPTAISELFKNAHDAYATHVEADFYRPNNTFTLRDDGLGMTEADFSDRWLTLGTDSKLGAEFGLAIPPTDPDQEDRPIMGEKGVGRLAIATLGPQVLVLSRAKRGKQLSDVVAAFINWELFECPGLDLSDVQIPLRTFKGIPTEKDVGSLLDEATEGVKRLKAKLEPEQTLKLLRRIKSFDVDPKRYFGKGLTLAGNGHGTAFIIQPADENLRLELDEGESGISPLVKMLIGFSNTMTPQPVGHEPMRTEFRDHRTSDLHVSLIGESEFFTNEDFEESDHRVIGEFDANGKFKGTVAVYDEAPKRFELDWKGKETACGPFSLRFGYVQGLMHESRLDAERWTYLTEKLERIGGLYLYRDGIRILPYGNNEFDFLDIELRRSKNASRAFFSYRRMIGAIAITRKKNPDLQEKAGREGFRLNRAYREFKAMLEHFLVQLAAEFFRKGGDQSKAWETRKAELEEREETRREREKESKRVRGDVQRELGDLLQKFDEQEPQKLVKALVGDAKRQLKAAAERASGDGSSQHVVDAESSLRAGLEALRASYMYERPKGFALDSRLQDSWDDYREQFGALDQKVFKPAREQIGAAADDAATSAKVSIDQRQRAERAFEDKVRSARKKLRALADDVQKLGNDLISVSTSKTRKSLDALEKVVADELSNFTTRGKLPAAVFSELRDTAIERIDACADVHLGHLAEIRDQLKAIDLNAPPGATTNRFSLTEALEEELIATRERAEEAFNIAQLGMAVEVINHEFSASIKGVRQSVRRLRTWADANEKLKEVYDDLQKSFEHLDGYLSLFTPLSRRVTRRPTEIKGSSIAEYLGDLFDERMKRHEVELHASRAFQTMTLTALPSTIYPVFVNLADNALYWLSGQRRGPRIIELDYRKGTMIVGDSGPGVPARDRDHVFERGFSRKPGGQGLGLYIARSVLQRNGYTLRLSEGERERGAAFEIQPSSK